ncbi:Membrane protein, MarC family [invertebrate metagenome]|uniref:Membrane protein, MarC family n=1 Tax=invertebrate metagenome TaxID=1711999 RepID=A0A484H6C7_9ZZZZ
MVDFLLYSFIVLFVVVDPVGTAALFVTMTRDAAPEYRRRMARRAYFLSTMILVLFAFGGERLLTLLGITLPAFRIGGGILLFLLAADIVFDRNSGLHDVAESENIEVHKDISVFPLAFPLIAGPGAMITVILLMGQAGTELVAVSIVLGMLTVVLAITWGLLLQSSRLMALLGVTGTNVISRLLSILLVALAVQLVLDGLHQAFGPSGHEQRFDLLQDGTVKKFPHTASWGTTIHHRYSTDTLQKYAVYYRNA